MTRPALIAILLRGLALALPCGGAAASAGTGFVDDLSASALDLSSASPVLSLAARPGPESDGAKLTLAGEGRELRLDGVIGEGLADRVATFLAAHPGVSRLRLDSEGGLVDEAVAVGRVVAAHGLSTSVTGSCSSACTLAYVRGHRRLLGPHGKLGFHGPYVVGFLDKATPVDPSAERNGYLRAGLTPGFVARALVVGPDAMWFPTGTRLRAEGVVTDGIPPAPKRQGALGR